MKKGMKDTGMKITFLVLFFFVDISGKGNTQNP